MQASLPRTQKGAAAIEFAAVFVIFFAVFYGLVSYSLPILMLQSFNQATAEAVRRCVALDSSSMTAAAFTTAVTTTATNVIKTQMNWMPAAFNFSTATDVSITLDSNNLLTVKITYAKTKLNNVLPFLTLPGIGQVPSLPDNLVASSSLQL